MFDRLEDLVIRYQQIMEELNDPNVVNDQPRFRKLMKEQNDLAPIVEKYTEYKQEKQNIEESLELLEMEVMPDHIHLLVDCKPQLRLSDAIKILKGNTARWLFLKHPEIKKQLWGGHLWNPSYFVATVSDRTLEQVKYYIDNQKKK